MNQYDPTFDLKVNVGHCELYFMVQWFYVTSQFGIMGQYDTAFYLKINESLCDLYFIPSDFVLYRPLFDAWVSYLHLMIQCDPNFDFKVNINQHIFHGLVILLNIF